MAIFSKKSKKAAAAAPLAASASQQKPQLYQHVPKHAATDSALQGATGASKSHSEAILQASRQRLNDMRLNVSSPHAGDVRAIAQNELVQTPVPSNAPRRSESSSDLYCTPVLKKTYHDVPQTETWDTESAQAKYESVQAQSSDSGYDSGGPHLEDFRKPPGDHNTFSFASFINDESQNSKRDDHPTSTSTSPTTVINTPVQPQRSAPVLGAEQPHLLTADVPFEKRNTDVAPNSQQVRTDSMPRHLGKGSGLSNATAKPIDTAQQSSNDHLTPPSPRQRPSNLRKYSSKAAKVLGEEIPFSAYATTSRRPDNLKPRVSFTQTPKGQSKLPARDEGFEFDLKNAATSVSMQHEAAARNAESSAELRNDVATPTLSPQAGFTGSQAILPPLSILDGFLVNKFSKVLDEEGQQIGEIVQGDILDCVRRRVNAFGEVLDESGGVVGRVATIPQYRPSKASQMLDNAIVQPSNPVITAPQDTMEPVRGADSIPVNDNPESLQYETQRPDSPTTPTQTQPTALVEQSMNRPSDVMEASTPQPQITDQEQIPNPFAYKGSIPMLDGPPPGAQPFGRMAQAPLSTSPQFLQVSTRSQRGPPPLPRMNSNPKMVFASQQQTNSNYPTRPSPLASSESSPLDSEDRSFGTGDKSSSSSGMQTQLANSPDRIRGPPPMETRPRTYFTHSGKITMSPGHARSESVPVAPVKSTSPVDKVALDHSKTVPKKTNSLRHRFSLGFGKKG